MNKTEILKHKYSAMKELLSTTSYYIKTTGNSMLPSIKSESIVKIVNVRKLNQNDIVLFYHPVTLKLILHRCISIIGDTFIMKGDNEDYTISITSNELIGRLDCEADIYIKECTKKVYDINEFRFYLDGTKFLEKVEIIDDRVHKGIKGLHCKRKG